MEKVWDEFCSGAKYYLHNFTRCFSRKTWQSRARGNGQRKRKRGMPSQVKRSATWLAELVRQIYAIAEKLKAATGRSFTPDGHMVGSIGEVFAADMYGLKLLRQSKAV